MSKTKRQAKQSLLYNLFNNDFTFKSNKWNIRVLQIQTGFEDLLELTSYHPNPPQRLIQV